MEIRFIYNNNNNNNNNQNLGMTMVNEEALCLSIDYSP